MKIFIAIILILFALQSCRSTEEITQRKGFRPYAKGSARGYEACTRNFVGYGTYQAPHRKNVDR